MGSFNLLISFICRRPSSTNSSPARCARATCSIRKAPLGFVDHIGPACPSHHFCRYTIKECVHSFCKSCIFKFVSVNPKCPECGYDPCFPLRAPSLLSISLPLPPSLCSFAQISLEFGSRPIRMRCSAMIVRALVVFYTNRHSELINLHRNSGGHRRKVFSGPRLPGGCFGAEILWQAEHGATSRP